MRGLVLSGGAFRGAVQLPVIEHLAKLHKYDLIYGVSVGSLNGVLMAQNMLGELRNLWEGIDDLRGFLKAKWYWPFKGLYSMKPLRGKIESLVDLDKLQTPFAAGVVSLTDGEYYNIDSRTLTQSKDLWDAIQASSAISGLMVCPTIKINGEEHVGSDGGFRNIIPIPPADKFEAIDIVVCTPLQRIYQKLNINTGIKQAARGIEIMEAEIFDKDIAEIKETLGTDAQVTLYAPQDDVGPSFEASRELISWRLHLGEEMINHPVIL